MRLAAMAATYQCGCGPMSLVAQSTWGEAGKQVRFQQTVEGPAPNASLNESSWRVRVTYFGEADGQNGTAGFLLGLYADRHYYEYEAAGQLERVEQPDGGGTTYTYAGTYSLITDVEGDDAPALQGGTFTLVVDFWSDGTSLYRSDLALQE
jgi:hypothetical protein